MTFTTETPLVDRMARYISTKPGRAARLLRDLDKRLADGHGDLVDRAKRDALLTAFKAKARCEICGRELSKESSVARGQGRVCAKKRAEAERRRKELG